MKSNNKQSSSNKDPFIPYINSKRINKLLDGAMVSKADLARYLNCSVTSLEDKFSNNSFSLYDFIVICHISGYSLSIYPADADDKMSVVHECIEDAIIASQLLDGSDDLLDILEEALQTIERSGRFFEFSIKKVLTENECNRIQKLENQEERSIKLKMAESARNKKFY